MVSKTINYKDTKREVSYNVEDLSTVLNHIDADARRRLYSSLSRTLNGFSVDLVTPMVGQNSKDKAAIRKSFIGETLKGVESTNLHALIEAEFTQAEKVGPISIMAPFADRLPDIERYFSTSGSYKPDVSAIDQVIRLFKGRKARALSVEEAFTSMPRNTNLGYPVFTKDKRYLRTILDRAMLIGNLIASYSFEDEDIDPALLYWRGQPAGLTEIPKQRTVWGQGHAIIIQELRLQTAVLDILRRMPEFAALVSQAAVDRVITRMIDESQVTGVPVLSVDFSGYDTTLPLGLFHANLHVTRELFGSDDQALVDFCFEAINHVPLITPIGVLTGWHTMPSGSGNTNWWDSQMQLLWWYDVARRIGNEISQITVQGDDGVVLFKQPYVLEEIEEIAKEAGLILSSDKGGVDTDTVYYLQNVHMNDYRINGVCVGVRPLTRALSGELSFETPRGSDWTAADTTMRWLQQLESCKNNPRLGVGVEILVRSDKLLQNYSLNSIIKMGGGIDTIEAALHEKSFPYGKEPISKVHEFAVCKLIDKIRKGRFLR